LDYLIKSQQSKKGGHVIFVTSSIPSEGKSLTSSSLAMIYAKANKKVLLLGADIRNPMIQNYYSLELNNPDNKKNSSRDFRKPGITDYLLSHDLGIGDLTTQVVQSDFKVDVIHAGKPMPNPSELLMNDRLETLFNELRLKYDYVIVDTAPMLVVSDTQLLTKYADQIVYVTRAGYTEVKVLEFPLKLRKEGKLPNLSFVVNDVKEANLGYGGRKYGYGYAAKTTKRFRFIPFLK
jgi:capsular exopolysaccharide synthesis family protein